jgi:Dolichyl-phosphate-mannose-protein mannosyltransferase
LQRPILLTILLAYAILGALYTVYTPKWQAPDEPAHFNYIRAIGDTGALPILQHGDYDQNYLEQIKAAKFPASMSIDTIRYESYQPPLYYLAATPIYIAARAGGIDAQVLALRLFGVALGALVLLIAYAVVREIFPDDTPLALGTVGAMATVPMFIADSASVSNDIAAVLVLSLILWLAVRRVKGTIRDSRFVILGGILFGAALLTKTTAYMPGALLLAGAEIAKVQGSGEAGGQGRKLRITNYELRILISLFALALLISAPMFIRNMLTYGITDLLGLARHNAVVAGQPTTAELIRQYGLNHILVDFFAVTFKSFWAQFGWMGVLVNDRIYVVLMVLSGATALGFVFYVWRILRHRDLLTTIQWWSMGLLAVTLVAAVVDYIGYNFEFFQLQGRYLFPGITAIALFGVIGVRELVAREYHRIVFALLYVALLALDVASLFLFIVPQLRIAN